MMCMGMGRESWSFLGQWKLKMTDIRYVMRLKHRIPGLIQLGNLKTTGKPSIFSQEKSKRKQLQGARFETSEKPEKMYSDAFHRNQDDPGLNRLAWIRTWNFWTYPRLSNCSF